MTTNHTITDAELQAIRSVDCHIRTIAHSDAFRPPEPVLEDIQQVGRLVKRLCTAPPIEEVASRPNGADDPTAGSPIGIVRDHPSHDEDLRSKSVVDRGSREIKVRWAKETIGLVTVQLNEAYAQFEIRRDGHTIPGGLSRAAERLGEVLQCLGIASNLDDEIPF